MTAYDAWRQICRAARAQISPALFRACFAGTAGVELGDDTLTVTVPNATVAAQLERRFAPLLTALAERYQRRPLRLCYAVPARQSAAETLPVAAVPARATSLAFADAPVAHAPSATRRTRPTQVADAPRTLFTPPELNPHYTFDNLVVGESNRLAFAAARSVADAPGSSYNPLFLYGGVGLGKTHLLMAIGHAAARQGLRVCYATAETFTNAIIDALQRNTQDEFRARYRGIDVLLVDDIQFIGGHERTEEEFFHTFNALHNGNKQIVVTSDRPPRAIPTLHDRLRSRFEWGLLADVTPPDYAHRLAIVTTKAEALGFPLPPVVLDYIARPEGTSVRALEGALNRVALAATMHGGPITLAQVAATLRQCFGEQHRQDLTPQVGIDLVASHYHVSATDLLGKGRSRQIAWPRQVAMYLLREETEISLAQIGVALGGRDHTTVMHGCDQVTETLKHDEHLRREIDSLRTALRAL